ncbi:aspartate aminotransferase family protein [Castellaniella sp.]|uniref:aminotransferase family protein n=1 Tax=Castellaniella sp. TaxID=1955812 RepID=UPI003C7778BA
MNDSKLMASAHLWNPFSNMGNTVGNQHTWVRGEGSHIYDESGKKYIDALASLWYMMVGYGREEIVEATAKQMRLLPAYSIFVDSINIPAAELSERIAQLTPGDLDRIFFTTSGSEAAETAIKIVRQHFRLKGQSSRYKIIGRRRAYHGVTLGALSVAGITANRRMFEPLAPGFCHVEHSSVEAFEELIAFEGPETIAAFFAEPIMGAGGVIAPPDDYFVRIREICDKHGILFVADEVICGFGRTGRWFGIQNWGVVPDLMLMAKGITSGYLPLGAVAVSDKVFEPFKSSSDADRAFLHGNTYSGHPTACAAALANIEIIEREGLVDRSATEGQFLHDSLSVLVKKTNLVSEVRSGLGLLAGVQLRPSPSSQVANLVYQKAYERGVIVRPIMGNIIAIAPPLIISREDIKTVSDVLLDAIQETEKSIDNI